jgi:hypothetical protein
VRSSNPASSRPAFPRDSVQSEADVGSLPWVTEGVFIGLLGAATVAAFFGVVDLLAGHPLWTPYVLGSAFFRGTLPAAGSPIVPGLVLGYTVLHTAVFAGVGALASFHFLDGGRLPGPVAVRGLVLAGLLFAAFEVIFVAFGAVAAPGILGLLGAGRVAAANLVASGVMAAILFVRAEQLARKESR